ncbi:hypothetical protein [Pseudomonas sp. P9(2020)]|uniref:hypothetical protein n=1 Tax=Pseudomonas sp. P9(2020) TaxID=2763316 RepID=UPI001B32D53C|nr:hypothetical protein [Pseudomonas sp. P9(2020)]MBP5947962.1 hypothetical protein [Pseudomonas sp. P9(2020)]
MTNKLMKNLVGRKRMQCALVFLAIAAIGVFQLHLKSAEAERVAERDTRCAKQAAVPYAPFKGDFGCVGWKSIKSDMPLPLAG